MLIRRETPQDVDAISAVTTAAFQPRPDAPAPPETALVSSLRQDDCWLLAAGCWLLAAGCWLLTLSVVAVADDAVIGHVVCSRGFVDDTPALGLGPEAQVLAEDWRQEFNGEHPHSALGYRSPAAFAAAWTAPAT